MSRRGSSIAPTRSPTMAGGLFAVSRKTFWELGSYDEEMEVWGGENLEMSFRIWQCGGTLETIPCSRVGHIFRSFHPYTFPGNKDTHGINTARTVEVWMEEYKRLFYMHRPDLLNAQIGQFINLIYILNDVGRFINLIKLSFYDLQEVLKTDSSSRRIINVSLSRGSSRISIPRSSSWMTQSRCLHMGG